MSEPKNCACAHEDAIRCAGIRDNQTVGFLNESEADEAQRECECSCHDKDEDDLTNEEFWNRVL